MRIYNCDVHLLKNALKSIKIEPRKLYMAPARSMGRLACMSIRTGGSCHAGDERFVHHSAVAAVCGSGEGTFHDRNWRILNKNEQFDGQMAIRCAILQSG